MSPMEGLTVMNRAFAGPLGSVVVLMVAASLPSEEIRRVPPAGVEVSETDRKELNDGVAELGAQIADLSRSLQSKPALLDLLPDLQIFHNAARYALTYNEFFKAD